MNAQGQLPKPAGIQLSNLCHQLCGEWPVEAPLVSCLEAAMGIACIDTRTVCAWYCLTATAAGSVMQGC